MPASLQQRRNSASWAAVNRVLSVTMFSASHSLCRCRSKRGTDTACMAALYAGVLHSKRISSFLPYCRFVVPVLSILQETCGFCNKNRTFVRVFHRVFHIFPRNPLRPKAYRFLVVFVCGRGSGAGGEPSHLAWFPPAPLVAGTERQTMRAPPPFRSLFQKRKVFFSTEFDRFRLLRGIDSKRGNGPMQMVGPLKNQEPHRSVIAN